MTTKETKKKEVKKEVAEQEAFENQTASQKKAQIQNENRILRNVLLSIGLFVLIIVAFVFVVHSVSSFNYRGTQFSVDREKNLVFYTTSFPVIYNGSRTTYTFYMRNDPRKLESEVPFSGEFKPSRELFLNGTMNSVYNCDDAVIAIANFNNLGIFNMQVRKDENASCDPKARYIFVNIRKSNETSVEQFAPSCYNININNCEILKGTERFMIEQFVNTNENLKK